MYFIVTLLFFPYSWKTSFGLNFSIWRIEEFRQIKETYTTIAQEESTKGQTKVSISRLWIKEQGICEIKIYTN